MSDTTERLVGLIPIRGSFDHELQLIREAIAMVAARKSPRVVIAGIRFAELLFDQAWHLALAAGVSVKALERTDHAGIDIAVERINR